ncbi:MAG: hypothetical protein ACK5OX_15810 [Desertimonas sp.]
MAAKVGAQPSSGRVATIAVWGARVAWLAVALVGGRAVGDAVADHAHSAALVITIAAWVGWAIGALALTIPATHSLTAARVVVPGALAVAVATAVGGADLVAVVQLAAPAALATVLVDSAEFGRTWVQASAYGDEQRFPLRPPLGYLLAATAAWIIWIVAVVVAVVACADRRWPIAIPTLAIALAGLVVLPRRWHQLSRRWLVSVPAGFVVHDPVVLGETLMLSRRQIAGLGAVTADARDAQAAADLSGPTPGVGVAVSLTESVTALFSPRPGLPEGRAIHLRAFVIAPSRPGAVLVAAARRRFPVRG